MENLDQRGIKRELSRIGDWLEAIASILANSLPRLPDSEIDEAEEETEDKDELSHRSNLPVIQELVSALQVELLRARDGDADPPIVRRQEAERERQKRRLEQEMADAKARLEAETTKLCSSMGVKAFKQMVRQNAINAGVPPDRLSKLSTAETITAVVVATLVLFATIDTIRGCRDTLERRKEKSQDEKRRGELERAYIRGIFTNASELERMERDYNTV